MNRAGRRSDCSINCPVVSADGSSRSQDNNQPPESPPGLAIAILNATQSIPSTSITPPVVIIRKPFPGPAPIVAQSGAAPQAQLDTSQMSSAAGDCAAPSAELVSGANHVSIESDSSSSSAYTSMISLPVANDQTSNEEAYVPAEVEAVVSSFFLLDS